MCRHSSFVFTLWSTAIYIMTEEFYIVAYLMEVDVM